MHDTIKAIKRPINLRYDTRDVRLSSATLALIIVVKRTCSVTRRRPRRPGDVHNATTLPLVRNKVTSTRPEPRTHFDTVNGKETLWWSRKIFVMCTIHIIYYMNACRTLPVLIVRVMVGRIFRDRLPAIIPYRGYQIGP